MEDDQEMDNGMSPLYGPHLRHHYHRRHLSPTEQPSAILIEPGAAIVQDVTQRPTIAQNMAFAALQQSQDLPNLSGDRINRRI